jgi:isopentenyl diphosphate isomerase/L-lactate dehydrogenase-like FMN-dependent dehydrogenase
LPRQFFDYIDVAANQEQTAAANLSAFDHIQLRQRILRDVSTIDTSSAVN